MSDPVENNDREALAESLLIDVFRNKEDFVKLLSSYVEATQELENVLFDLFQGFNLSTAVGDQLDASGQIVGEERQGTTDERYRLRIRVRVLLNLTSGTPNQIIHIVNMILDGTDATSTYTPYYPASFLINLVGAVTEVQAEEAGAAVLEAAQQPGSLAAILSPDDGTGRGIAAVTQTGVLTLAMQDLAPTTGTQVYETWVIPADGIPVALGGFQVGRDGTATFEGTGLPVADGIVLALTLEPQSGMQAPTGPVVSKGVASSAG